MLLNRNRALASIIITTLMLLLVGGIWFRAQTVHHSLILQAESFCYVEAQSWPDGISITMEDGNSPFVEGNELSWDTYRYPFDLQEKWDSGFTFSLGYPFMKSPEFSAIRIPYWHLILLSLLFAIPAVLYQRMRKHAPEIHPSA